MTATTTEDQGRVKIFLRGAFIDSAGTVFWRALKGAKGWNVVIDLTAVTKIDDHGLAMIEAAVEVWKLDLREFTIVCPDGPVKQMCLSSRIAVHLSILS